MNSVQTLEPTELADIFQQVIDLYVESLAPESALLVDLLKNDWQLFEQLNASQGLALLSTIYPDANLTSRRYVPKIFPDYERITTWNDFQEELKHKNRYFPKQVPDPEHLEGLFSHLILPENESPTTIYRARCNQDNVFSLEDMSKPSEINAGGGRANPIGIPYLYAASEPETAIAEIRPYKSDTVSVAEFAVSEKLVFVDLRNPRKTISPFELTEDGLNQIYIDIEYLCNLGKELSKPILPREAHLEYLSTQYLCELIKHFGYDGVVYKSSIGNGDNYAIFNDDKLRVIEIIQYEIKETTLIAEPLIDE